MSFFKDCPHCGQKWRGLSQFLDDVELKLVGYQADFQDIELGLLLFNHHVCGTTLAIRAESVKDLYDGPVYTERRTGSESCTGRCLHQGDLDPCAALCSCAWVREILQIIRNWSKTGTAAASPGAAAR